MTETKDDLRILDNIEIHERPEDRRAAKSGLVFYVYEDELRRVDNNGRIMSVDADENFGWIMNNSLSTTSSGSGSVTFEYDRVEIRESGDGAATRQTRAYDASNVGVDPSEAGSIRIDVSNVDIDDQSDARMYLQLTDAPDSTAEAGGDFLAAEVRGDGEVRAHTSEDNTAGSSNDTSQDNTFVKSISYVELAWDGSAAAVIVGDGNGNTVTVSDNSNYPSGENLYLSLAAEDQAGSNQRNVDYDVNRVRWT